MAAETSSTTAQTKSSSQNYEEAPVAKSVWGKPAQPVAASLSDVMSEQLATDIQEKEAKEQKRKEDQDIQLAKELHSMELGPIVNETKDLSGTTDDEKIKVIQDNFEYFKSVLMCLI